MFQANAYLQSSAAQGRTLRASNQALRKEHELQQQECRESMAKAQSAQEALSLLQGKYDSLSKKKAAELRTVVEAYTGSAEFLQFMDDHDDQMRPVNMGLGWDRAIGAVHHRFPDVVNPSDFPFPGLGNASGVIANSNHPVSSGSGSSSSKGKAPMSQSSGSKKTSYGKIRQPLSGKGVRNEDSSSSSSSSEEEEDEEKEGARNDEE